MKRTLIFLLLLVLISVAGAFLLMRKAEEDPTAEAGSTQALVGRCAFCHGPEGLSENEIWPSLAGLDAAYIESQLNSFAAGAEGGRSSPHALQMYAISALLDEAERKEIAEYYAALPPLPWSPEGGSETARVIYQAGDGAILACASCHGDQGEGLPGLGAPRIAGQPARYTAGQLAAYASGARHDNGSGMAAIAQAMSEDHIRAISAYLEGSKSPL